MKEYKGKIKVGVCKFVEPSKSCPELAFCCKCPYFILVKNKK